MTSDLTFPVPQPYNKTLSFIQTVTERKQKNDFFDTERLEGGGGGGGGGGVCCAAPIKQKGGW